MLVLLLFLSFFINLHVQSDNIKDFEIEGISLGDSLLDFYSEKYIKTKNFFLNQKKLF